MALKDMAYTKAEAKEEQAESVGMGDPPKYPWCLTLYLNDEVLKKLGMDSMPAVGAELMLVAKVQVTGTSSRQNLGGDPEQCVDLQITEMDLGASVSSTDERNARAASKLYKG
jgi:hypothetical protein